MDMMWHQWENWQELKRIFVKYMKSKNMVFIYLKK